MKEIAISVLIFINTSLGIKPYPDDFHKNWWVNQSWKEVASGFEFSASTEKLVSDCHSHPQASIVFPKVLHSAHTFYLDEKKILSVGDPTFQVASPYYQTAILNCDLLTQGKRLTWNVITYSKFFARLLSNPEVRADTGSARFFSVTSNLVASGVILLLAIFSLFIFWGRVSHSLSLSVALGGILLSGYFAFLSNSELGMKISMLTSHKITDTCLWLGVCFFFSAFFLDGYIKRWIANLIIGSSLLAITMIWLGNSGDEIQLGTMLPMIPSFIFSFAVLLRLLKLAKDVGLSRDKLTKLLSMSAFLFFANSDLLNIFGIIDTYMFFSFGIVGAVFGLSVAVNQEISKTYSERDQLLTSLEEKVSEKTKNLSDALTTLKTTQAELVQSARLASLGTLSAGVAHEINNAINFVSGALKPLEKKVMPYVPNSEVPIVEKLFKSIKDGTGLTVDIVRSLRNYTGLNHAQLKDISVREVVDSVLNILKNRLREVNMKVDVDPALTLQGSMVGMSQIFMNLITNSLDALPARNSELSISAKMVNSAIEIQIIDNGQGIPKEIKDRIFDPFFTTKDVGKGTGLGLYIVSKEVDRHKGTLSVKSEVGKGTQFTIRLPAQSHHLPGREAA